MNIKVKINIIKQKIKRVGYFKTLLSICFEVVKPIYRIYLLMINSYSQAGEDIIVEKLLKKKKGFYIDIGANHPVKLNNTYRFYKKGWRGINIEPDVKNFMDFSILRKNDINLNCGLSDKNDTLIFYVFERDVLSTFSKDNAEELVELGYKIVEKREVKCYSLKEIFENYSMNKEIDLLSIDTEGYDYRILNNNDWVRFRPSVIITESNSEDVCSLLANNSYSVYTHTYIYKERLNTIYIDNSLKY
jgi:FkbM family methyltransferase